MLQTNVRQAIDTPQVVSQRSAITCVVRRNVRNADVYTIALLLHRNDTVHLLLHFSFLPSFFIFCILATFRMELLDVFIEKNGMACLRFASTIIPGIFFADIKHAREKHNCYCIYYLKMKRRWKERPLSNGNNCVACVRRFGNSQLLKWKIV